MQLYISKNNKNKIYLTLSIACIVASLCAIAWIDRQEVDKKINEQAALICAQKNTIKQVGTNDSLSNQPTDANASIETKSEAKNSLKNIDNLMNSVGSDSSTL
ncbi:MAG: hypothetical protein HGA61_04065 [Candidatus Moranbacteria bacterium]|nr:hypothetical protein [Candidatus Moranbacteria bacterium]